MTLPAKIDSDSQYTTKYGTWYVRTAVVLSRIRMTRLICSIELAIEIGGPSVYGRCELLVVVNHRTRGYSWYSVACEL